MLIPTAIFLIAAWVNGYVPFGSEMLNSYDSFTQYSGMLLEYSRLLRGGNIFYSWGAGLGFNFFSSLTYYGMSPLNLLSLFATPENYHIFIALMTYARFMLLGGTMCFYLSHKKIKPLYIVMFSTIYALMGYTSTYYYNYIWIDSIIMLPLIIHGLDELIKGKNPLFYIVTLTFTILINYYIGYMICIFCLIWFLYNVINIEDKKTIVKTFIMSSLLSGLMGMVVIIPSFFALMTGKAELYNTVNYFGISRNAFTFFYTLTAGAYQTTDQSYGPALIYVTIMTFTLVIFYFFNEKFTKKEKIATLTVIAFFYLSFSVNILNYAWQLFQKPIWWQSRFSFVFSFFLITIAVKTLMNIEHTRFKIKPRLLLFTFTVLAILVGAYFKWQVVTPKTYTYIYLGLSILLLAEMFFLLDKKGFLAMLIIFTAVELSLNTYNSLKNNVRNKKYDDYLYVKEEVPKLIEKLNEEEDNFYRLEFMDDYTSDDGLYFGYNGLNYFNSVRNINVIDLIQNLGVTVYDKCHIKILEFDPVILSLLNIKYIYGQDLSYLKNRDNRLLENSYPLGLGFMAKSTIKNVELDKDEPAQNKDAIVKALTGLDYDLYQKIERDSFEMAKDESYTVFTYSFTSDKNYLLMPEFDGHLTIDGIERSMNDRYVVIEEGSEVTIEYRILSDFEESEVFLTLLDLDSYRLHMRALEKEIMHAQTNTEGNILKATVTSSGEYDYLFTSIEYERGMKVYLDDEEIEPDIILGALIGLPLEKGTHEIRITYIPRGLIPGAVVSITSLVASIIYLQRRKKVI